MTAKELHAAMGAHADEADWESLAAKLRLACEAVRSKTAGPAVPARGQDVMRECSSLAGYLDTHEPGKARSIVGDQLRLMGRPGLAEPAPATTAPGPVAKAAASPAAAVTRTTAWDRLTEGECRGIAGQLATMRADLEARCNAKRLRFTAPHEPGFGDPEVGGYCSLTTTLQCASLVAHCRTLLAMLGEDPERATKLVSAEFRRILDAVPAKAASAASAPAKARPEAKDLARSARERLAEMHTMHPRVAELRASMKRK